MPSASKTFFASASLSGAGAAGGALGSSLAAGAGAAGSALAGSCCSVTTFLAQDTPITIKKTRRTLPRVHTMPLLISSFTSSRCSTWSYQKNKKQRKSSPSKRKKWRRSPGRLHCSLNILGPYILRGVPSQPRGPCRLRMSAAEAKPEGSLIRPVGQHHPECGTTLAIRLEEDHPSVGRPAGVLVVAAPAGELSEVIPIGTDEKDVEPALIEAAEGYPIPTG